LTQALDGDQEKDVRLHLAGYLVEVTRRLKPVDASQILNQVLAREKDPNVRLVLADALASAAARLEPDGATWLLNQALAHEPAPEDDAWSDHNFAA
jgi:hypothetical protein